MLRLNIKTKLSADEAIRKAVAYFHGQRGLEVTEQGPASAFFTGGGGIVEVYYYTEGKKSSIELVSREWDYQVKEFAHHI